MTAEKTVEQVKGGLQPGIDALTAGFAKHRGGQLTEVASAAFEVGSKLTEAVEGVQGVSNAVFDWTSRAGQRLRPFLGAGLIGTVRTKTMYDRGVPRAFVLPLAVGARGPDDAPGGWQGADLDETACPIPRGERGGHPWRRRRSVLGLTTIPTTAAI
jgi:hypothetical protein